MSTIVELLELEAAAASPMGELTERDPRLAPLPTVEQVAPALCVSSQNGELTQRLPWVPTRLHTSCQWEPWFPAPSATLGGDDELDRLNCHRSRQ